MIFIYEYETYSTQSFNSLRLIADPTHDYILQVYLFQCNQILAETRDN